MPTSRKTTTKSKPTKTSSAAPKATPAPKAKRKTTQKQPAKPATPRRAPAAPQPITYTLDSLAKLLGAPDATFASRTFRDVREDDLLEQGTRTDSQNILDDVPAFVGSALAIRESLSTAQRSHLLLPPALLAVLVAEAVALRSDKATHDVQKSRDAGGKVQRDEEAARERREGIAARDLVYDGLKNALGSGVVPRLDAVVGTAETPEKLAGGMEALAGLIEDLVEKGDHEDVALLESYGLAEERAASLRAKAAKVRAAGAVTASPTRTVTQRALDLQDGRVLLVIEKVLRAFRAANRVDSSILVPPLGKIAWMFESRSRSKPAAPEATAPAPKGPTAPADGAGAPVDGAPA